MYTYCVFTQRRERDFFLNLSKHTCKKENTGITFSDEKSLPKYSVNVLLNVHRRSVSDEKD